MAIFQICEVLKIGEVETAILERPFEQYLNSMQQRPKAGPCSSANWRCYVGYWEIIDDTLYLNSLCLYTENHTEMCLEDFFDEDEFIDGRIPAKWFYGVITIPDPFEKRECSEMNFNWGPDGIKRKKLKFDKGILQN